MSSPQTGRIIKLLAGFYFVALPDSVLRCRARGSMKNREESPVVGDMVEVLDLGDSEGVVTKILPRKNLLQRPTVANVSQLVVMASFASPDPNLLLLDRLLVTGELLQLEVLLCFNKADLQGAVAALPDIYRQSGYPVVEISLNETDDHSQLYAHMRGRVAVLAGQSGVGKSSLLNRLRPELGISIGEVSDKTQLGKHTTRHVELISVKDWDAYVVDTPGFSKLDLPDELAVVDLSDYYPEMRSRRAACKFGYDCRHQKEPGCAIIEALKGGEISQMRYGNYIKLLEELTERERSRYK